MTEGLVSPADLPESEIFHRLSAIVAESLRIKTDRITRDTSLVDLGAESIDVVEITLDVEHAFSVLMPERSILQLAGEVTGEAFEHEGALTPLGSELLRARMPEVDASALATGTRTKSLTRHFLRIDVWIRLVRGLLEATPRSCHRCGGHLEQGAPTQVKCRPCGVAYDVPSGDDIGRAWVRTWWSERCS